MLDMIFEIYKSGLVFGIIAALTIMLIFLIVGVIRFVKRYAYAQPMYGKENDDATDCSFVCRGFWCLDLFAVGKPILEDTEVRKHLGAAWQGTALDIGLGGAFFLLLGLLWPVALPLAALWFPMQAMHNHHTKKKEFLEKLQGKHEESD